MRCLRFVLAAPFLFTLAGCPRDKATDDDGESSLTRGEAQEALEQAEGSSAADSLESANIEISTSFTLGGGLAKAAGEIRDAIATQLPCADVTVEDHTLTVEWGVNPGSCTYRGHTFTGTSSISVEKNDDNQVLVHHEWTDLSNGKVTLNGSADVTWDFDALERHVVHHTEWTHEKSGLTGVGDGDRTQSALNGDITEGVAVSGTRSWTGKRGTWDLAIEGVEWRWIDPIPQAGSYALTTPAGKHLTLSFERADADTIAVTVAGGRGSFSFNVTSLGSD
jgi:hypothetical protein